MSAERVLPISDDNPRLAWAITFAVMVWPDNPVECAAFVQRFEAVLRLEGRDPSLIARMTGDLFGADYRDLRQRRIHAGMAGEILRRALSQRLSVDKAIAQIEKDHSKLTVEARKAKARPPRGLGANRTHLWEYWSRWKPVAHLWASYIDWRMGESALDPFNPDTFRNYLERAESYRLAGEKHTTKNYAKRKPFPILDPAITWRVPSDLKITARPIFVTTVHR